MLLKYIVHCHLIISITLTNVNERNPTVYGFSIKAKNNFYFSSTMISDEATELASI